MLLLVAVSLIPACGSGGSDGQPAAGGTLKIQTRGGAGATGNGGHGGYVRINGNNIGGNVDAYATGAVNAAIAIPNAAPNLGDNPRTVTLSTTWTVGGGIIAQSILTIPGDLGGTATGLWVKPGVTLTIEPNFNNDAVPATNEILWLIFANGIYIEGTVVVGPKDGTDDGADLDLDASDLVIASAGILSVAGSPSAGANGGWGGDISFGITGAIVNHGTIDATGADDDVGGNGGAVGCLSSAGFYNGGTIDASGGDGSVGAGGNAQYIDFEPAQLGIVNNGTLLSRGGAGATQGGTGEGVYLYTDSGVNVGALASAGTIDASGGDCTDTGNGGAAGMIDIDSRSGTLRLAGALRTRGGTGGPNGGNGGAGDNVELYADGSSGSIAGHPAPEGIFVGADIDASGGDGDAGGNAGRVTIENYSLGHSRPIGITLVGYALIDASGGDGQVNGGNGGGPLSEETQIQNNRCQDSANLRYYGGRIYNEVPFAARGGLGLTGNGGNGGKFGYYLFQEDVDTAAGTGLTSLSTIDTSGGEGAVTGGSGGYLYWWYGTPRTLGAEVGIVNAGTLDCSGGNGGVTGGAAGGAYLYQQASYGYPGTVVSGFSNSGAILSGGGDGGTNGGGGAAIEIDGDFWVRNSATVDCSGGNGGGAGSGGNAANCTFNTMNRAGEYVDSMEVLNSGAVLLSGGDGGSFGGDGAWGWMECPNRVVNSGLLHAGGGSGAVDGGDAGAWALGGESSIYNSGPVLCDGGTAGSGTGGRSWGIWLGSKRVTNSSGLSARGGDASLIGGTGGDASYVELQSTEGPSAVSGSSMDVRGGSGAAPGTRNYIWIDGIKLDAVTASF